MKKILLALSLAVAASACSRSEALDIPAGSDVSLQKKDGVTVAGRLVEAKAEHVVIEGRDGVQRTVPRSNIAELRAVSTPAAAAQNGNDSDKKDASAGSGGAVATTGTGAASGEPSQPERRDADEPPAREREPRGPAAREEARTPAYREVTLPAGTVLPLTLRTAVGSDTSRVEDQVRATLRRPVTVSGVQALPAGTALTGHVTHAKQSARVKGRGEVAFRFTRIDLPGDGGLTNIRTGTVSRVAPGTKKRDAATIGGGAVGGAIVGGILGGGDGAAKGAAIGGAGGTGVVLATRGKDVRLAEGTTVSVRLTQPLTVRVPR